MDWEALVTDKQRYKEMMINIRKRANDVKDNYGHDLDRADSAIASSCSSASSSLCEEKTTIRLDNPIDGFGGCGLQVTFSANNLEEACQMHDQLIPLGPLILALSAATPIYKGQFVATDTRWAAMCMAGDDRKSSEKLNTHPRLGCTPMYLEECFSAQQLNDRHLSSVDCFEPCLRTHGLPPALASYFSHVLSRDPLIDISRMPEAGDTSSRAQSVREELLYLHTSTYWPHVRLKLPVLSAEQDTLPWRLEFRPMEAQPDVEGNAALVIGIKLLQQTIHHHALDLRIPISAVEGNFNRASHQGAVTDQEFWFAVRTRGQKQMQRPMYEGWASLDVIFNGGSNFAGCLWMGLVPLAMTYLTQRGISKLPQAEQTHILNALNILSKRASGKKETPAKWMRTFVNEELETAFDEREISSEVYYKMIRALSD